jgi:hypothetical protein
LFIWQLPINILRLRPFHCCCCSLAPLFGWRTTWTCSLLFSSSVTSVEKKWGLRVPSCLQWQWNVKQEKSNNLLFLPLKNIFTATCLMLKLAMVDELIISL